ncbi:MAG: N-formylglutamate amidohydrolase [Sandaracinaceae bacterium]
MRLPLLLSVPHGGLEVPDLVADQSLLDLDAIVADGDEGAIETYAPLAKRVRGFARADVARAFVDMNRAEDDLRKDGVVKTHTCWDVPIYRTPLTRPVTDELIARYHRPYHETLGRLARTEDVILGVDCHTMAAFGPPVGPDPGRPRPLACLGVADGTCPPRWAETLAEHLREALGGDVRINDPFRGGYIIRSHARELPWVMLELSRTDALSWPAKGAAVARALEAWCARMGVRGASA